MTTQVIPSELTSATFLVVADFGDGSPPNLGSGVCISPKGQVLACARMLFRQSGNARVWAANICLSHVLQGQLATYRATLQQPCAPGGAPELALLQLDSNRQAFACLSWSDQALSSNLSCTVVGAFERVEGGLGSRLDYDLQAGRIDTVSTDDNGQATQFTYAISPVLGMPGGAVVDTQGCLLGIDVSDVSVPPESRTWRALSAAPAQAIIAPAR